MNKDFENASGLGVGRAVLGVLLFGVLMLVLNGPYFLGIAKSLKLSGAGEFDQRSLCIRLAAPIAKASELVYGCVLRGAVESTVGAWVNEPSKAR